MIEIEVPASTFSKLLQVTVVGPPPPEKTPTEMAWEDDGGALDPWAEPWTYTFTAVGAIEATPL